MNDTSYISAFLVRNHQPPMMKNLAEDRSKWLSKFADKGRSMCRAGNADFVVLEGSTMQAFAAQDESDFVAMYAGMFWMLSRLAARVAASGAFSIMEGASDGIWTPDVSGSFQAPRELLEEGTAFDWELESAGWRDAPERVSLFYFTLDVLFKFVVFHELGHLHNDHGRRRTAAANQSVTRVRTQ